MRHRHLLGDPTPQPDHLDVFDRALRLQHVRSDNTRIAGGEGIEIFVRDATGRPGARYLTQVDAGLARAQTYRGRRDRLDRVVA